MAPHGADGSCHGHGHGHSHGHSHGSGGTFRMQLRGAPSAATPLPRPTLPTPPAAEPPQPPMPLSPLEELFACAKLGDAQKMRALLDAGGADGSAELVRRRDAMGHTITHWAAQRGGAELLKLLAGAGAPLDLPSEDSVKLHPVHWACAAGNLPALRAIIALGVDVNCADAAKQRTPLLIAAQHGFPLLVMFLIRNGADVALVDVDQDSAIHWAAYKGATEIVSVFQYLGLRTDEPDRFGQTPLHLAAMRGELAAVQYLVEELESDLEARDGQNRTPYDLAVLKGYKRVSTYLARQGFRNKWNVFAWWEASRAPYYFVLTNAVVGTALYLAVLMPTMPDMKHVCVPHMLWNALTWVCFFFTVRTSPGDVAKDERHATEYTDQIESVIAGHGADGNDNADSESRRLERPLCHSCHVQRPLRSKHCRVCKTCIHQFDHHCPFVDNCVGLNNHVYFMAFLVALVVDIVLIEYALSLHWRLHGFRLVVLGGMLYLGAILLPTTHLFGFHVYLTAKNLTTNEVMNSHRYQHMRSERGGFRNPFDKGVVRNIMERCLPAFMTEEPAAAASRQRKAGNNDIQGEYKRVGKSDVALPV